MLKASLMTGRLLCWLSFHDFSIINKRLGFGSDGGVEKVACQQCGVWLPALYEVIIYRFLERVTFIFRLFIIKL